MVGVPFVDRRKVCELNYNLPSERLLLISILDLKILEPAFKGGNLLKEMKSPYYK